MLWCWNQDKRFSKKLSDVTFPLINTYFSTGQWNWTIYKLGTSRALGYLKFCLWYAQKIIMQALLEASSPQFGIQYAGVAPSASDLLKLSAPRNGDPVPVCHGTWHRKDFNICHGWFQLLPGRGSSSGHKGCLCRAWCDGRAKLLHVMCLGNWEMAEISGSWHIMLPAGIKSQSGALFLPCIPVSSFPAHSPFCLGLMALYFIFLFIKQNLGLCSLRISWNVVEIFLIIATRPLSQAEPAWRAQPPANSAPVRNIDQWPVAVRRHLRVCLLPGVLKMWAGKCRRLCVPTVVPR